MPYEYAFAIVSEIAYNTWTSPKMKVEMWKKHRALKLMVPKLAQAEWKDVNAHSQFTFLKVKICHIVTRPGSTARESLLKETPQGLLDWFNPSNAVHVGMTS